MDFSTLQASANFQALVNQTKKDFTSLEEMTPKAIMPEQTIIQSASLEQFWSEEIANAHYHNHIGYLSAGKLKDCKTPLHLKLALENPTKPSKTLNIGSAAHSLILEPEKFEYRLFDDTEICNRLTEEGFKSPRSTKAYKEWKAQFEDENGEIAEDVMPKESFTSLWKLKKQLRKDPVILELFKCSINEISYFASFKYPVKHTGENLKVKIRPDAVTVAGVELVKMFEPYGVQFGDIILISVKTTIDASSEGFIRQAKKMQYDLSEAFYNDVLQRFFVSKVHTVFLTIEKDGDVFTGHYLLRYCSQEFINSGRELYRQNLEVYCNSNDLTEGYQSFTKSSIVEI